jgi:cytoskeletal protein CcmA (bactofilin family)
MEKEGVLVQMDIKANSVIGERSSFEGRLSVKGNLRIDGRFEGESLRVEQITIGPSGRVKSNIFASSVVIEGIVIGNITATHRILLFPTARVLGDIKTPELIMQDGVVVEGKCTVTHQEIRSVKSFIEKLYNQEIPAALEKSKA